MSYQRYRAMNGTTYYRCGDHRFTPQAMKLIELALRDALWRPDPASAIDVCHFEAALRKLTDERLVES